MQLFLNKETALSEWVCQQQSTASGDSRQLAAMVMGIASSSSVLTSSDSLTTSQKLPSDPSLLRGYENERGKGNSLLRKVWINPLSNYVASQLNFLHIDTTSVLCPICIVRRFVAKI